MSLLKGGSIATELELDIANGDYKSIIDIQDVTLSQFSHFIRPFANIRHIDGNYSSQLSLKGNYLQDTTNFTLKGGVLIDNFRLLDDYSIVQVSFDSLAIGIDSIDLKSNQYRFNEFSLSSPTMNYALYPESDSFSNMFYTEDSITSEIPVDTSLVAQDTTKRHYSIHKANITNGSVGYQDYTLINNFSYSVDAIDILTDSINSSSPQSKIDINALLNYLGELKTNIHFDVSDSKNFFYNATVDSVSLQDFSPYSIQYIGNAVTDGMLFFEGNAKTSAHFLKSNNNLILDQLKLGSKIKHDESYNLPVKTAVSLLKNPNGKIKIKLPVRGNLDDPTFKIWRTVLNTLKNLVIKTVASPITAVGKVVTVADKDITEINYMQTRFSDQQKSVIKNILRRIKEGRGHEAIFTQFINPPKEKAIIAMFEAKRKFFADSVDSPPFSQHQANQVLPIDASFQKYINGLVPQDSVMSLIDKCYMIVGSEVVEQKFQKIVNTRNSKLQKMIGKGQHIQVLTKKFTPSNLKTHRPVFKVRKK